jgi:hypothetical protein
MVHERRWFQQQYNLPVMLEPHQIPLKNGLGPESQA